ncbi:MAG: hypothetical protein JWN71_3924 [Xanthobacteraceae bacterium]|nr:hypothetical protein [Xanthobacteraceae bacterium]
MNKSKGLEGTDWHFRSDQPLSFNCLNCFLLGQCGGLRVKGSAMDCQRFCCGGQEGCNVVCFNSPVNYARRLGEVGGFGLKNVDRCAAIPFPRIRGYAPLIHHAYSRKTTFPGEMVALSLYELLDRDGAPKYFSRDDVARNFRIRPDAKIIISGVHKDKFLERFWRSAHRNSIVLMLKSLDVALMTSPNFSVYNNVPRPENLYNIKRIALIAQEFLALGVPTALHINACTEADYLTFTEFLADRPEFEAISFEFITGPGYPSRMNWHIKQLMLLANAVGRPLQLVLRGGTKALFPLSSVFHNIVSLDSDPLHRALHRQRLVLGNDGRLFPVKNTLPKGTPVDELLVENALAATSEVEFAMRHSLVDKKRKIARTSSNTKNANYKAGQLSFLPDARLGQAGADAIDGKRVIATTKTQRTAKI